MFRDDHEALLARVRTLESEVHAERRAREAAEAETDAAIAARDEALVRAKQSGGPPRASRALAATTVIAVAVVVALAGATFWVWRSDHAEVAWLRMQADLHRTAKLLAEHRTSRAESEARQLRLELDEARRLAARPASRPDTPAPSVGPGGPRVQIAAVVQQQRGKLQSCYEQALRRKPSLAGRVQLRLSIEAGKMRSARVESSTLEDAAAVSCMLREAKRWVFPDLNGHVEVSYPFVFRVTP